MSLLHLFVCYSMIKNKKKTSIKIKIKIITQQTERFYYDNKIVKLFAYATIFWGVVGMLVGLLVALQMYLPALNFNYEFTTFGRTRPLHTNAVIFSFVGNGIFTGVY